MTKKHYTAIANVLKAEYDDAMYRTEDFSEPALIQEVAENLADYFATDNPKFNRERFLGACGIDQPTCTHKNCNNTVEEQADECRECYEKS
jgi:hypothetical protein